MNADRNVPRACAACKHLRQKCDHRCVFKKYFPLEKMEDFLNVHRLFGASNFTKILNSVPENKKDKTVESLILEAKMRKENPVHGSLAVQRMLQMEIERTQRELEMVNKQLHLHKGGEKVSNDEGAEASRRGPSGSTADKVDG